MLPDYQGFWNLLTAFTSQWLKDALHDPNELDALAWWLDIDAAEIVLKAPERLKPRTLPDPCPICGKQVVRRVKHGRIPIFCSLACWAVHDRERKRLRREVIHDPE